MNLIAALFLPCLLFAQNDLVVHEWGTFTTLSSSSGEQYETPIHSLEALPDFVYHQKFKCRYWDSKFNAESELFANVEDANTGMETPVVYFYSGTETEFRFDVQYQNGSVSSYYPRPSETEDFIVPVYNFQLKGHTGYCSWKGKILAPDDPEATLTHSNQQANALWNHPRNVDANMVEVEGQKEKYLFYRGFANYSCPIEVQNDLQGRVRVLNHMDKVLPFFICTEYVNGELLVHHYGRLEPGACDGFSRNTQLDVVAADLMIEALIEEGLYRKEAEAMLATWNESYFQTPGMKVFWIVPRPIIDELLPVTMNPVPKEFERAFFGRIEVMEAAFEKEIQDLMLSLEKDNAASSGGINPKKEKREQLRKKSPYLEERMLRILLNPNHYLVPEDLEACPEKEPETFDFRVYPNPTDEQVFLEPNCLPDALEEVWLMDTKGVIVRHYYATEIPRDGNRLRLYLLDLEAGLYFIRVSGNGSVRTRRLQIR